MDNYPPDGALNPDPAISFDGQSDGERALTPAEIRWMLNDYFDRFLWINDFPRKMLP